jgi:Zn-dependent protease with chaperone function
MKSQTRRRIAVGLTVISIIGAPGCSQRDQLQPEQSNVWMVSERREIAIGEEVAKEVEREYTVYQDADLAAYVDQVGQSLARNSDRSNINYHFKVLDSPIANAFATPGGYIYITRGMLGVLDDEAEMAGVIGHEIGHVAARHSAKQIQASTLASIGLLAVGLAVGDRLGNDALQAANAATSLIFLGYSRSDEDQADLLGMKYLYRTGYDPEGMVGVLEGLLELQNRNPMQAEQFFQSHPLTRNRVSHVQAWLPRVAKEDVWGGIPPGTNLRGRETYQRVAAPHAIFQGGDEMLSVIENYRIALVRGQRDLAAKSLDDSFQDDKGRSKGDHLASLDQLFAQAKRIDYKVTKIETEPRRTGGAAKYEYLLEVTNRQTGNVYRETGRAYLEFVRPETHVWKISSIRTVTTG